MTYEEWCVAIDERIRERSGEPSARFLDLFKSVSGGNRAKLEEAYAQGASARDVANQIWVQLQRMRFVV